MECSRCGGKEFGDKGVYKISNIEFKGYECVRCGGGVMIERGCVYESVESIERESGSGVFRDKELLG